jgi:hypothetical protein
MPGGHVEDASATEFVSAAEFVLAPGGASAARLPSGAKVLGDDSFELVGGDHGQNSVERCVERLGDAPAVAPEGEEIGQ